MFADLFRVVYEKASGVVYEKASGVMAWSSRSEGRPPRSNAERYSFPDAHRTNLTSSGTPSLPVERRKITPSGDFVGFRRRDVVFGVSLQ